MMSYKAGQMVDGWFAACGSGDISNLFVLN